MAWIKFARPDMLRDRAEKPQVSIWKKGTIAFTKAAEEHYGIKSYRYALLFFDPEARKIGIKLTKERSDPDLYKVTPGKSNLVITAPPFFREFKIPIKETKRYDLYKEGDMLVIRLEKES
ncbi:MAG: hypothetical protein WAR40_04760 [Desulfomonilia bacterium]